MRDIGNYQKADSIWFSSNDQLREKFERDSTEYELIYMLNEVNIALSLIAQGKRDNVENMLTKWIDTAQKEAIKDPNSSADFLQMIREGLISYYAMTKETEKLLNISRDIEKDFQKTLAQCREVTLETIKHEKLKYKIMGQLAQFIAPLM